MVNFQGIRDNILVGYGIVSGLSGTGDNLQNSSFTQKGLVNLLEKLGINTRGENIKTKNIAAVMVTATLPGFAKSGNSISVNLSTVGDAKSVKGGTLLPTALIGVDGKTYAVAQGQVSIGALSENRQENLKPMLTSGYIINGAIVEREVNFKLNDIKNLNVSLKNPDLTTARAVANAINSYYETTLAYAEDPATVSLKIPQKYKDNIVSLLADIENISVSPDTTAKIIIDERTGTIVMGKNVKISTVAVAQNNLVVKVTSYDEFKMENQLNDDYANSQKSRPGTAMKILKETADLSDLVQALNGLGVKPQNLIAILKAIKDAGALQAVIEMR